MLAIDHGIIGARPLPHCGHRVSACATTRDAKPGRHLDPVAVFAHDFRGPLANLLLIVEQIGTEARARGHTESARSADRAEAIIERLAAMTTAELGRARARADAPNGALKPLQGIVDVAELLQTAVGLNQPLSRANGVELNCLVADPPVVRGDSLLIMQAVDNLLHNAITFTRTGGRVVCEAACAANGDAVIRITDEGPGLTADDIARAFQPFARLSGKSERPRQSNGLGLAIVKRIAEAHGGSVMAESPGRGQGASFTLSLPAVGRHP